MILYLTSQEKPMKLNENCILAINNKNYKPATSYIYFERGAYGNEILN